MTGEATADSLQSVIAGATTLTARALQRLAVGLMRDAASVSARDVGVQLSDERGALRIAVTVPVAMATAPGANLVESGERLRQEMVEGMRELAGREVGAVDIRYSGVRKKSEKRAK